MPQTKLNSTVANLENLYLSDSINSICRQVSASLPTPKVSDRWLQFADLPSFTSVNDIVDELFQPLAALIDQQGGDVLGLEFLWHSPNGIKRTRMAFALI